MRNSRELVRRLVVLSQRERLPLHALADGSAADALGANARRHRPTFRLFDMHGLEIDEVMSLADTGRLATVATEVFGLTAFDLGIASACDSIANVALPTHDVYTLFQTKISPAFRDGRREYIAGALSCKTEKGTTFGAWPVEIESRTIRLANRDVGTDVSSEQQIESSIS